MNKGKIIVAGIGPGSEADITPAVLAAIQSSDVIIGYKYYFRFITHLLREGTECIDTGMKREQARAEQAFAYANEGKTVCVISSGDAGIYGMTPLIYEMKKESGSEIEIESYPGISAFQKAASLLGAPIGHDFCVISLSDLMTPWELIEKRIRAAAMADFVTAIYNPKSEGRYWQLYRLKELFLQERKPETPVGYVRQAGREEQEVFVTTLADLDPEQIDMFTVVLIGNSQTYLSEEYAKKMASAQSGEELVQLYREENAMMAHYHTASCLASIHYTQDTRDEYWSGEQEWFDATSPAVSNAARNVAEAILSNPHAKALEEAFGTRILPSLRNLVLSMDDRVIELQKEENALTSAYQKLYGGAMAELDGKQLTIPQLTLYKQSTDPAMRRKAYEAEAVYFDAHRAEFDEIYDKMVKNRNEQARILGYNDYSELSYIRMNRIGYGPAEVAAFRQEVVEQVVPMIQKALALRNKRTGIENPMFWDSTISFADGNPVPHGSYDELMAGARKMYHELSPETAEFIDFMQDNEMFDVLSRPGKMSGGYEEMLPDYKTPFIFANWNGTAGDVDVLTHEAGHALEGYLAARSPKNIPEDIQCPGMESAEIHSMSMEFLTAPWHHLFFKEDTDKYELLHAEDSFIFLPYGCMVDEFQHIMYQQPDLTPDERNAVWLELEKKYRPWNKFGDLPFYGRGAGWQRQLHIFECPFYYIDYCLATAIALPCPGSAPHRPGPDTAAGFPRW